MKKVCEGVQFEKYLYWSVKLLDYLLWISLAMIHIHIFFSTAPDGPPENVTVLATSPHSINISWSEPLIITGPTCYLIDITSVRQLWFIAGSNTKVWWYKHHSTCSYRNYRTDINWIETQYDCVSFHINSTQELIADL